MTTSLPQTGKINTGFSRFSDPGFSSKAMDVYTSMLDNANFPNPLPAMPDVLTANTEFNESLAAAQTRERTAVAVKNQKRAALIAVLKALAAYVTYTAQGDVAMLVSSGFTLAKARQKAPAITKPENIQVEDGINPCQLISSVDGVKGAKVYAHQYRLYTPEGNAAWNSINSTSKKCIIDGLISGQKYEVRIGAIGTTNQVVYSDVISRIVQ